MRNKNELLKSSCEQKEYDVALNYLKKTPPNSDGYSNDIHFVFTHTLRSYVLSTIDDGHYKVDITSLVHFELYYFSVTNDIVGLNKLLRCYSDSDLIRGALLEYNDYYGNGILLNVCIIGHVEALSLLLDYCFKMNIMPIDGRQRLNGLIQNLFFHTTIFHMSAKFGRCDVMRVLLEHRYSRIFLLPFIDMKSMNQQTLLDYAINDEKNNFIVFLKLNYISLFKKLRSLVTQRSLDYLQSEAGVLESIKREMSKQSCQMFFANTLTACAAKFEKVDAKILLRMYISCCEDIDSPLKTYTELQKQKEELSTRQLIPRAIHSCCQNNCYFNCPAGRVWMSDFITKSAENMHDNSSAVSDLNIIFFGSGWLQRELMMLRMFSELRRESKLKKLIKSVNIYCIDTIYKYKDVEKKLGSVLDFYRVYFKTCFDQLKMDFSKCVSELGICDNINIQLLTSLIDIDKDLMSGPIFFVSLDFDLTVSLSSRSSFERHYVSRQILGNLQSKQNPLYLYLALQLFKIEDQKSICSDMPKRPIAFQLRSWKGKYDATQLGVFYSSNYEGNDSLLVEKGDSIFTQCSIP